MLWLWQRTNESFSLALRLNLSGRENGALALSPFTPHRDEACFIGLDFLLWEAPCLRIVSEVKIDHGMFSERNDRQVGSGIIQVQDLAH